MKVLQVNCTDLPGRRFNGYDLLTDLRSRGIRGKQAVLFRRSEDPDVRTLMSDPGDDRLQEAVYQAELRHSMDDLLYPWGRVLAATPEFMGADVVHYHLVHGRMISLFDLPWLSTLKPSVWTMHDAWALTGHCIQPGECVGWREGCAACPDLDSVFPLKTDRADQMWRVKQRVLADVDMDIVVASEFMLDMVRRSPLTQHFDHVHLIPFGIDVSTFLADEERAASRKLLGIGADEFVICFRSTAAPIKGLEYIKEALGSRPPSRPTTLLTVDEPGLLQDLAADYRIVELGWVDDESRYRRLLSACDVFVMPSTAEAFGLMAVEAMAAGRPVICFEGTALAAVTHAPDCGIAVKARDSMALRAALDELRDRPEEAARRGRRGRQIAAEQYGHDRYLDALAALYGSVLTRSRPARLLTDDVTDTPRNPARGTAPLAGVRVCLVFEHSLSHYTRLLDEIEALQNAGARVHWLTSNQDDEAPPAGVGKTVAPLVEPPSESAARWRPLRVASNVSREAYVSLAKRARPGRAARLRVAALTRIGRRADLFWVVDFPSLPTAMAVAAKTKTRVVYETVDLVPEYRYLGDGHRSQSLQEERRLIGRVDGFITACDSYADYYMERYGDALQRPPVVRDNMPRLLAEGVRATTRPLRMVFLGTLMFDRPVVELLQAMALSSADSTLTLQGKNLLGEAPATLISELGLQDRVEVVDPCPPSAIVETAASYDIGVVALWGCDENERRAATSKLFTYMAAGLAVLGSDLPGIARIVRRHSNGVLAEGMRPEAWATAMDELASLPTAAIDDMKRRSLEAARLHAWQRQAPAFLGEFSRALGRPSGEGLRGT